jgi:hypothetical protein
VAWFRPVASQPRPRQVVVATESPATYS